MLLTRAFSAARMRSPVPIEVARIGSRSSVVEEGEAGGRGHLDRRALPVVRDQPPRRDLATERIAGGRRPSLPPAGRLDRGERAFAAVGQRAEQDLVVGAGAAPAVGQRLRDLDRGQRPLERVGRDEDGAPAHRRSFQKNVVGVGVPSVARAWFGMTPSSTQPCDR